MDPNKKPDQLIQPTSVHQGGRVEGVPIAPERYIESSHPMPEVSQTVKDAGVAVVDTAPKLSHTMFNNNPDPKVEIPAQDQTPAWLEQQIKADTKNLDNNSKDSKSWLGRLRIAFLEKIRANKLDSHSTTG